MRRTLTFTGVALLLALAGCTSSGASPSSSLPVVTSSAAIAAAAQNTVYVTTAQANAPDLVNTLDDASIVAAGRQFCAALSAGTAVANATAGLAATYGAKDAEVLAGTAADVYCTGQDVTVDALVKTPGP
ncbi:DUF732 domain-containing protein [Streptacidiphilus sp. PAMC 29251]